MSVDMLARRKKENYSWHGLSWGDMVEELSINKIPIPKKED